MSINQYKDVVIVGDLEIDYRRYTLEGLPNCYSLYDNAADQFIIENVNAEPDLRDVEDNIPGGLAYMLMILMNEDNGMYLFEIGAYLESPPLYHVGLAQFASGIEMLTVPN